VLAELTKDKLKVEVYEDRAALGQAAAAQVAIMMRQRLAEQETISMVFAAAPSQNEFLAELCKAENLDWQRVTAFHMDEYVGLTAEAPQSFRRFLKEHLFDAVKPGQIHYLKGDVSDAVAECQRYADLLTAQPPSIVCAGIGENGHLAFNDPHIADFNDSLLVKVVDLDAASRQQQVNDECFEQLADVPTRALTVTVPALTNAQSMFVVVPGKTKANAVHQTLNAAVSTDCPATILRQHKGAVLLVDRDAASQLAMPERVETGAD